MGTRILDNMCDCDEYSLDLEKKDKTMIKDIIEGKLKYKGRIPTEYKDIQWAFEIVNNKTNSIDVDKFDYLKWDAEKTGKDIEKLDLKSLL